MLVRYLEELLCMDKKLITIIISTIVSLLLMIFLVFNFVNRDETIVETVEVDTSFQSATRLLCKLELRGVGEYDVAVSGGNVYVYKDGENLGKSQYSLVSRSVLTDSAGEAQAIAIDAYADDKISNTYDIDYQSALSYIEYLKQSGYTENARVYTDNFIEGVLDGPDNDIRYIAMKDKLIMSEIANIDNFGTDYFIDNYIK